MLSKPFQIVLAAAALAGPGSALASEPARPVDPAAAREAPSPRSIRATQPELICRTVDVPGADAAAMVCMTAIDWRRAGQ